MFYISQETIANAYANILETGTQNKFWGLLSILQQINDFPIRTNHTYILPSKEISLWLDKILYFGEDRKNYNDRDCYVRFPNNWIENIAEPSNGILKINKINVLDIACFIYKLMPFEREITSLELISKFKSDFNLTEEIVASWFVIKDYEIKFCKELSTDEVFEALKSKKPELTDCISFESPIKSRPGELTRAPFIQTLYAGTNALKCLMFATFNLEELYPTEKIAQKGNTYMNIQKIYFGSPGSGKSFTIRREYENDPTKVIRTTFHPDTDYATFVGCYKPKKEDGKITYEFIPQSFTDAYIKAWNDLDSQYYLILEEINRGNCAQIFGDLFQLLDRNEDGWSEYPINADSDLKNFLLDAKDENGEYILKNKDGILDGKLCLPPNLSIIASMNTSDQSLFPMDSAFKRRWTWEYVPIDYANAKSGQFTVTIGTKIYRWHDFLEKINDKIKSVTSSEDKQMGNFFIKHSVDEKEFKDKVMFYIWSEIGKDNYQTNEAVFKCFKPGTADKQEFSFNELYSFGSTQKMQDFMTILQVPEFDTQQESFEADEDETSANGGRGKTMSLNGGNLMFKSELGFTIMDKYVTEHPELSYQQIKATFPDTLLGHNLHRGLVVDTATDLGSYDRYYSSKTFTSQDGVQFRIYKQWTKHNIENIANFARKQGWSVEQR